MKIQPICSTNFYKKQTKNNQSSNVSFHGWRMDGHKIMGASESELMEIAKYFHKSSLSTILEVTKAKYHPNTSTNAHKRLSDAILEVRKLKEKLLKDGSEKAKRQYEEIEQMAAARNDIYYTNYESEVEEDMVTFYLMNY